MSGNTMEPLAGEPALPGVALATKKHTGTRKEVLAIGLLAGSLVVFGGYWGANKVFTSTPKVKEQDVASSDRPTLRMPIAPRSASAPAALSASGATARVNGNQVPNIESGGTEAIPLAGSTGARGTAKAADGTPIRLPEDAPMFAGSGQLPAPRAEAAGTSAHRPNALPPDVRETLDAQKARAERLMKQIQDASASRNALVQMPGTGGTGSGYGSSGASVGGSGIFGLERTNTPAVPAKTLADRSLTIPKGTFFACGLTTKVITAASGMVGCQVMRNVYGDDGKVVLIERGSHVDGEYRVVVVKPGLTRIPVLWTRVRTPTGVVIDLDSVATGALGESGLGGYVDNRWGERLGAALLMSLVDDALKYAVSSASDGGGTVVLGGTAQQGSKMAEKILDATINIPPLLYANQGGVVGVYVARDLEFASVYELRPQ